MFKGNVAAVFTKQCRDHELTVFRANENTIKQHAKKLATEGKLTLAQQRATLKKLCVERLSERQRKVLGTGVSSVEFHDLGSTKILGGIGKGLAEAIVQLKNK